MEDIEFNDQRSPSVCQITRMDVELTHIYTGLNHPFSFSISAHLHVLLRMEPTKKWTIDDLALLPARAPLHERQEDLALFREALLLAVKPAVLLPAAALPFALEDTEGRNHFPP
jgi:hypothetical protein